jgi:hypothetical protein
MYLLQLKRYCNSMYSGVKGKQVADQVYAAYERRAAAENYLKLI